MIALENAGFAYEGTVVLEGVTACFERGQFTAIAGPNGAGKSTLLGVCAGLRGGYRGSCRLDGTEVRDWKRRDFSRQVAFVPQSLQMEFPFSCGQVVLMGRAPFGDGLFETAEDLAVAEQAMARTECAAFRDRDFRSLSGGERQRVVLAAALAQQPRALLLDEPTTFLDLKHQLRIYELLAALRREGLLVIAVTHDLTLAGAFADQVLLLDGGRLDSVGPVRDVLTAAAVQRVFGIDPAALPQRPF